MRKQRSVLLDGTFIAALLDAELPAHGDAVTIYSGLVDRFETGEDRLFALSTVLATVGNGIRRGRLAPVETLWVAWQHRHAVHGLKAPIAPDTALTLVMLQRERIRTIATASADFAGYDLTILRAGQPAPPAAPNGYVSYRTEPLPALQSPAE